jgi:Xaa-Pro aminopeptidase
MVLGAYKAGTEAKHYQQMTCEFFAERGHPTIATDSQIESGYVHTIGHGLGLNVHEEPRFTDLPSNTDVLKPGHIFTCEPGLYYPDRGFGVRIEDDVWVDPDGGVHNLTDFPKELVIAL